MPKYSINALIAQKKLLLPLFTGGASLAALSMAWISQYIFGLAPCPLCMYQRYPYMVAIVLSIIAVIFRKHSAWTIACGLAIIALLIDGGIGFYHMGVEYGWFTGFESCSGGATASSTADILKQIMNSALVRCDEPQFVFILSMAGWNMLYAWGTALLALVWIRK